MRLFTFSQLHSFQLSRERTETRRNDWRFNPSIRLCCKLSSPFVEMRLFSDCQVNVHKSCMDKIQSECTGPRFSREKSSRSKTMSSFMQHRLIGQFIYLFTYLFIKTRSPRVYSRSRFAPTFIECYLMLFTWCVFRTTCAGVFVGFFSSPVGERMCSVCKTIRVSLFRGFVVCIICRELLAAGIRTKLFQSSRCGVNFYNCRIAADNQQSHWTAHRSEAFRR